MGATTKIGQSPKVKKKRKKKNYMLSLWKIRAREKRVVAEG